MTDSTIQTNREQSHSEFVILSEQVTSMSGLIASRMDKLEELAIMSKNLITGNGHPEQGLAFQVAKLNDKMDGLTHRIDDIDCSLKSHVTDASREKKERDAKVWDIIKPMLVAGLISSIPFLAKLFQ